MLEYYDSSRPLTLLTHASLKCLGAVLLQEDHPIYFTSKSLLPHQKAQFQNFQFGKRFHPEADQKPLENVLAKSLIQYTTKTVAVLMRTLQYVFSVNTSKGHTTN